MERKHRTGRRPTAALVSVVVHGGLLALVAGVGIATRQHIVRSAEPVGIAQIELMGGPGRVRLQLPPMPAMARTRRVDPKAPVPARAILPAKPATHKDAGGGAPAVPAAGEGTGPAAKGNGDDAQDAQPAFPVFSPHPAVSDRALLPESQQNIVVDVSVDAQGGVVKETLVKGIGNGLDQIVLDTVKQWRFKPATVNGKAVPTEAELIFPFDQRYRLAAG